MKNLLLAVFVLFICGNIFPQTWQPMGVPEGSGVTDLVYWSGGGAVFGDKLWATTGSVDWPTGQRGGVFYSATSGTYQGIWYRSGGSAGYYIGRTLEVGQDGKLYASLWRDPATSPADALCRFEPAAGIFGFLYQAQAGDNIFSIAVKNNPHTIFGGTRNGVIRSTDNGLTFQNSSSGIPANSWVRDLAIDSAGVIAAATTNGLFISTDNGNLWQPATGIPASDTVVVLRFHYPTLNDGNESELYAGTENGKLYKSFESADYTVCALVYLFDNAEAASFAFFALGGIELFYLDLFTQSILIQAGIFGSTDPGQGFTQQNEGLPQNPRTSALAVNTSLGGYATLFTGLFENSSGGAKVYKRDVIVGIKETSVEVPLSYKLEQNYPNPFNPSTKIKFSIPQAGDVKLEVFNLLGERITTLVDEFLSIGNYETEFSAVNLPSGIYFYKLQAGSFIETKKMILIK
jgi:hypothetical protein